MRLFQAPILCPSGGGGTRGAGVSFAERLIERWSLRKNAVARCIWCVSTRFGEGGVKLDGCRRAREMSNRLYNARKINAQICMFPRGILISEHGLFFSYEYKL